MKTELREETGEVAAGGPIARIPRGVFSLLACFSMPACSNEGLVGMLSLMQTGANTHTHPAEGNGKSEGGWRHNHKHNGLKPVLIECTP